MAIPGDDGSTERRRNDSCLTANIEDLGSGAKDDAGHRGVARDLVDQRRIEDDPVSGLMEASDSAQRHEIDMDVEVRPLAPTHRGGGPIQKASSEIPERIGPALGRGAPVAVSRRWHQAVDCRQQRFAFELGRANSPATIPLAR